MFQNTDSGVSLPEYKTLNPLLRTSESLSRLFNPSVLHFLYLYDGLNNSTLSVRVKRVSIIEWSLVIAGTLLATIITKNKTWRHRSWPQESQGLVGRQTHKHVLFFFLRAVSATQRQVQTLSRYKGQCHCYCVWQPAHSKTVHSSFIYILVIFYMQGPRELSKRILFLKFQSNNT